MRLRAFSRAWRSLVMGPKRRISPLRPGSAMAMTMESLWTSRPRYSVIAFMVWLSVRVVHLMNQNVYPAHSEDVLAALPIQGNPRINGRQPHHFFQP